MALILCLLKLSQPYFVTNYGVISVILVVNNILDYLLLSADTLHFLAIVQLSLNYKRLG